MILRDNTLIIFCIFERIAAFLYYRSYSKPRTVLEAHKMLKRAYLTANFTAENLMSFYEIRKVFHSIGFAI